MSKPGTTSPTSLLSYCLSRGLALSVALVLCGYILLFIFKEGGGLLSDIGFLLVLPIVISGLTRSYVPAELFWPIFAVLEFLYAVGLVFAYRVLLPRLTTRSIRPDNDEG